MAGSGALLGFGFQSTYANLKDISKLNCAFLDGRSDISAHGKPFSPPQDRFKSVAALSAVVMKLKKESLATLSVVSKLGTNYRLAQLLSAFKKKCADWNADSANESSTMSYAATSKVLDQSATSKVHPNDSALEAKMYLTQANESAIEALQADFKDLFQGGRSDAASLDLKMLSGKPDLEHALIDCCMYEDDELLVGALNLLESYYDQKEDLVVALQEVTLVASLKIAVYGDFHRLKGDISELIFRVKTPHVWGVRSKITEYFRDRDFASIMQITDRFITFMLTPQDKVHIELASSDDSGCYQHNFKETGLDGVTYECRNVWSLDVAAKWVGFEAEELEKRHQNILRALNLQSILAFSLHHLDPDVAFKGIDITEREKHESRYRISMAKRALIVCCTVFAASNDENQRLLFENIAQLEALATPAEAQRKAFPTEPEPEPEHRQWPFSICELSQNLIMSILKKNTILCERLPKSTIALFSNIANLCSDVSASPALDLFFILMKPEDVPIPESQHMVCTELLGSDTLGNIRKAVQLCLDMKYITGRTNISLKKPAKIFSLLTAIIEGGNEAAAAKLRQVLGLTVEVACGALVAFFDARLKPPSRSGRPPSAGATSASRGFSMELHQLSSSSESQRFTHGSLSQAGLRDDDPPASGHGLRRPSHFGSQDKRENELDPADVLHSLECDSTVAPSLFRLIVEMFFLLPLTEEQLTSQIVWNFISKVVAPTLEALSTYLKMTPAQSLLCADAVELAERFIVGLQRTGLFSVAQKDKVKERTLLGIGEDVQSLLHHRRKTPEHLRSAFLSECDRFGVEALSADQFFGLIERMSRPTGAAATPLTEERRQELQRAFNSANVDGDGCVNM